MTRVQSTRETHSPFGHIPATKRLKSRHCFLSSVQPENFPAKVIRCSEWRKRLRNKPHIIKLHKEMAKVYESPWTTSAHGYTCSKTPRKKWKLYIGETICACGKADEAMAHMLQCSQLAHPCSLDDLITLNDVGKQCVELWKKNNLMARR